MCWPDRLSFFVNDVLFEAYNTLHVMCMYKVGWGEIKLRWYYAVEKVWNVERSE